MSDFVHRLLEAIEAKAARAREATPGPWHIPDEREPNVRCGGHYVTFVARDGERCAYSPDVTFHPDGGRPGHSIGLEDALFVVDNDPATVLRRCEADRKLLARGGPFCNCYEYGPPTNPNTGLPIPHHYDCSAYEAAALLAEVYGITEEE